MFGFGVWGLGFKGLGFFLRAFMEMWLGFRAFGLGCDGLEL